MVKVPAPKPLASVTVPSLARVSATKLGWFGLLTSTLVNGTRALRTQRQVQNSLEPV
jgi:hypothetical protein